MIKKNKEMKNNYKTLSLISNKSKFVISSNDEELIWSFKSKNGDNTLIIPIYEYELYEAFLKLYTDFKDGNIFIEDEIISLNQGTIYNSGLFDIKTEIKNTSLYNKIYHNDIITYCDDLKNEVNITKGEDYFRLEFNFKRLINHNIIFKKSSFKELSFTNPFYRLFYDLYNVDYAYHQMNFYEFSS